MPNDQLGVLGSELHLPNDRIGVLGSELPFAVTEYSARLNRTRESLGDQSLDAILMFHQESMHYLFGYDQLGYWIYQTAILPADGRDITVVCRTIDNELIDGLPFVDDIVNWTDDSLSDAAEITVQTLARMGLLDSGKRIGIELRSHALLAYYFERLREQLNGRCELVDASDLVAELRLRKSLAEVEYVRKAASILDAGYASAFQAMQAGNRELDVMSAALQGMFAAGGEAPAIWPPVASGPRTLAWTHASSSDRVIDQEEMVQLMLGGCYRRYHAAGVQSKWIGDAPAEVREAYEVLTEAHLVGMEHAAPGVPVREMAQRVNSVLELAGMWEPGQHLGYGTGTGFAPTWVDNLRIKEHDPHIFEQNFVFFPFYRHTVHLESGPVAIMVGEPILVTDRGCEQLSKHALTLELDA
ncbi:M24 family metallopeptidase [Paenarthrobacter sp. NPDC058040]|uniref:M24 family metallopeptidase n=1 Tax=unclassified Paenarthrobacter TaxID=2634190 RepID=UPI0036DE3CA9